VLWLGDGQPPPHQAHAQFDPARSFRRLRRSVRIR
jgi:hypothetical protein